MSSAVGCCQKTVVNGVWYMVYKWKNHFYEMKGDVGMSLHEKERNKKMPTPRHKVTHNPIPTSLFCFNMLFVCLHYIGKANSTTQQLGIQLPA